MLEDLDFAYLDACDEGLPDSIDEAASLSFRRQGYREMIEAVDNWEPYEVTQERQNREGETNE